jgi:hypothetical protein
VCSQITRNTVSQYKMETHLRMNLLKVQVEHKVLINNYHKVLPEKDLTPLSSWVLGLFGSIGTNVSSMDCLHASPISLLWQMRREVVGKQLGRRAYVLWLALQLLPRVVCSFFFHMMNSFLYAIFWPP